MTHNAALLEIESRKETLVARCAAQRVAYAAAWRGLEQPAAKGKRALNKLRSPWIWVGLGLLALKLPLGKISRMPILLFKGWQLARKIHAMIR